MNSQHIIIYTKTGCPWCKEVLEYLKENNLAYEEREVTKNKNYFDEMVAKSSQTKVPTLDIDGVILADYDRAQLEVYMKNLTAGK